MSYGARRRSSDGSGFFLLLLAVFLLAIVISIVGSCTQRVTVDRAETRMEEEMYPGEDVVIVRHSNNWPVFGTMRDVTFEIEVGDNGERKAVRCKDDWFAPMICRTYDSGSE